MTSVSFHTLQFTQTRLTYLQYCKIDPSPCSRKRLLGFLSSRSRKVFPLRSSFNQLEPIQMRLFHNQADSFKRSDTGMVPQLELESSNAPSRSRRPVTAIYWILLLNLGLFVADHFFGLNDNLAFYLYHDWPRWYQFITATFCHLNWNHLSSNLFLLYIFGKLIEEEEGGLALWFYYLITGAGANLVSWLILPRTVVSAGASGAVFGLFAISVLVKISWDWRKILEVLILGQFVLEKVLEAAHASALMASNISYKLSNINHIAHLSGALIGVAFIWLVSRISPGEQAAKQAGKKTSQSK